MTPTIRRALLATWLLALVAGLSLVANDLSAGNLVLFGLIGVIPPVVLLVLSREAPRTTAEIIRDVENRR